MAASGWHLCLVLGRSRFKSLSHIWVVTFHISVSYSGGHGYNMSRTWKVTLQICLALRSRFKFLYSISFSISGGQGSKLSLQTGRFDCTTPWRPNSYCPYDKTGLKPRHDHCHTFFSSSLFTNVTTIHRYLV